MNKRIIAVLLTCLASVFCLPGCSATGDVPEFKTDGGVTFTAYASPTINRSVDGLTEDAYKKLSEAGFNKAVALYEGASSLTGNNIYETIRLRSGKAQEDALKVLDYAAKYNIKYCVRDWSFYGLGKNFAEITTKEQFETVISQMFSADNKYIDHSAYGGNFGFDEPSLQEMETIVWQTELYNKYIAENGDSGGEIFINLNPMYVGDYSATLSKNKDITYEEYVQYYFDNIAPLTGYVCFDFYPFVYNESSGSYVREFYYRNIELMAQHCKETGYELRMFVQSTGDWTGIRNMCGIGDLRFQIYSGMAFGAKEFVYYTYGGMNTAAEASLETSDGFSLYNYKDGSYYWTYDCAKQVNNEVHAMETAYDAYSWDSVMYYNANKMYDNQLFANLLHAEESNERIKEVKATQDTLIGTFKAKDSSYPEDAFMIVNSTDPNSDLDDEVTVYFKNASSLLMYRLGEEIVVPLNRDGSYTFKLYPGEGRFVIPLK